MSPLAIRKSLLIAESELNRVHLADDLLVVSTCIGALADRAVSFGTIASSVVGLMTSLAEANAPKTAVRWGWLQRAVRGASLLTSLWQAFRTR
jgi:hypothetical protein